MSDLELLKEIDGISKEIDKLSCTLDSVARDIEDAITKGLSDVAESIRYLADAIRKD
jgi:hypothetical protein